MAVTIVQPYVEGGKSTEIKIRPFVDPSKQNMGLERESMIVFDGVFHEEQLACIERNGVILYVTGLNEFAPEVKLIEDKDKKAAKIEEIRKIVAQLEKDLAANVIDPKDKDFWDKVKLLRPDNHEFWGKITLRCGNNPIPLDPKRDPFDLIKICAIEAGGFSMVAPSLEHARTQRVAPKFYLDKAEETVSTRTEITKLRNKALVMLQELYDKNPKKLLYVAKAIDENSTVYKNSTLADVLYENMDRFIHGEGVESNVRRAIDMFTNAAKSDMESLKIKAMLKDAHFHRIIVTKSDGFIYYVGKNGFVQMGRNLADCIEFLKNPLNDEVLVKITAEVEKQWNL